MELIKEVYAGFRSPLWLVDEIDKAARRERRSRSDWMRLALEEALEARKAKKEERHESP